MALQPILADQRLALACKAASAVPDIMLPLVLQEYQRFASEVRVESLAAVMNGGKADCHNTACATNCTLQIVEHLFHFTPGHNQLLPAIHTCLTNADMCVVLCVVLICAVQYDEIPQGPGALVVVNTAAVCKRLFKGTAVAAAADAHMAGAEAAPAWL